MNGKKSSAFMAFTRSFNCFIACCKLDNWLSMAYVGRLRLSGLKTGAATWQVPVHGWNALIDARGDNFVSSQYGCNTKTNNQTTRPYQRVSEAPYGNQGFGALVCCFVLFLDDSDSIQDYVSVLHQFTFAATEEVRTCEAWFQLTFRPQKWNLKAHVSVP